MNMAITCILFRAAGQSDIPDSQADGPTWPASDAAGAACKTVAFFMRVLCRRVVPSIEAASGALEAQRWAAPQP